MIYFFFRFNDLGENNVSFLQYRAPSFFIQFIHFIHYLKDIVSYFSRVNYFFKGWWFFTKLQLHTCLGDHPPASFPQVHITRRTHGCLITKITNDILAMTCKIFSHGQGLLKAGN